MENRLRGISEMIIHISLPKKTLTWEISHQDASLDRVWIEENVTATKIRRYIHIHGRRHNTSELFRIYWELTPEDHTRIKV